MLHKFIYACGAIALALLITWVCFTFAGYGHKYTKPPVAIEHVNPPVLPPVNAPMPEPEVPAPAPTPEPPPATVEPPHFDPPAPPPVITEPVVPDSHAVPAPIKPQEKPRHKMTARPKHVPHPAPPAKPPVQVPYCLFSDDITGDCIF